MDSATLDEVHIKSSPVDVRISRPDFLAAIATALDSPKGRGRSGTIAVDAADRILCYVFPCYRSWWRTGPRLAVRKDSLRQMRAAFAAFDTFAVAEREQRFREQVAGQVRHGDPERGDLASSLFSPRA